MSMQHVISPSRCHSLTSQIWGKDFALESLPLHGARTQAVSISEALAANTGRVLSSARTDENKDKVTAPPINAAAGASRWVAPQEEDSDEDDSVGSSGDDGDVERGDEIPPDGDSPGDARRVASARKAAARAAVAAALPRSIQKARAPYMKHELAGRTISSVRFKPYDDVLAVGTALGLCSMIVPGAGEPNPDSREADPHQGKKARQEAEVHALLDKLPPSTIALDPSAVGSVNRVAAEAKRKEDAAAIAGLTGVSCL